jgi:hypothetical protein
MQSNMKVRPQVRVPIARPHLAISPDPVSRTQEAISMPAALCGFLFYVNRTAQPVCVDVMSQGNVLTAGNKLLFT